MASRNSRSSDRSSQGPNMMPVILAMAVLVGGALLVAVMQNKKKDQEAAAAKTATEQKAAADDAPSPFGDRDNSPKTRDGGRMAMKNTAPAGLAETALWVEAKKLGDRGIELVKEATKARKAGDEETFRTKGLEGRELLEEAVLNTGDWIIDLDMAHPGDRQVDKLSRERGRWQDHMKKVRKI